MTAAPMDDVDLLLDMLKPLPLIETADLDAPLAAWDAFELVLSAITRAAPGNRREDPAHARVRPFRRIVGLNSVNRKILDASSIEVALGAG